MGTREGRPERERKIRQTNLGRARVVMTFIISGISSAYCDRMCVQLLTRITILSLFHVPRRKHVRISCRVYPFGFERRQDYRSGGFFFFFLPDPDRATKLPSSLVHTVYTSDVYHSLFDTGSMARRNSDRAEFRSRQLLGQRASSIRTCLARFLHTFFFSHRL